MYRPPRPPGNPAKPRQRFAFLPHLRNRALHVAIELAASRDPQLLLGPTGLGADAFDDFHAACLDEKAQREGRAA